jgi:hypothetical protein
MPHIATLLWTCVLSELANSFQSSGQSRLVHLDVLRLSKRLLQGLYLGAKLHNLVILLCIGRLCSCDAAAAGMANLRACKCLICAPGCPSHEICCDVGSAYNVHGNDTCAMAIDRRYLCAPPLWQKRHMCLRSGFQNGIVTRRRGVAGYGT